MSKKSENVPQVDPDLDTHVMGKQELAKNLKLIREISTGKKNGAVIVMHRRDIISNRKPETTMVDGHLFTRKMSVKDIIKVVVREEKDVAVQREILLRVLTEL